MSDWRIRPCDRTDIHDRHQYMPGSPYYDMAGRLVPNFMFTCPGLREDLRALVAALTERAEKAEAARDHYRSESTHFQREYDDACAQFDALTEQTETAEAALTDAQAWIDRIEREYRFASAQVAAVRALCYQIDTELDTYDRARGRSAANVAPRRSERITARFRAVLESTKEEKES